MNMAGLDENLCRAAFEKASMGILIGDPTGCVIDANPAVGEILGYTPQELRGMSYSQLMHPDDLPAGAADLKGIREGSTDHLRVERRFIHKSGRTVWCRADATVVRDASGVVRQVISMFQDVTERRRGNEELRRSEERFRTAFETAPIGIVIADAIGGAIDANPAALGILGYSLEELRGRHVSTITHPDDVAASLAAADRIRQGQADHIRLEKRYIHKNGRVVWCRLDLAAVRDASGACNRPSR